MIKILRIGESLLLGKVSWVILRAAPYVGCHVLTRKETNQVCLPFHGSISC